MVDQGSLTKNQTIVLDALAHAEGPLGAYALLDRLRDQGFRAPLQVYRALDKLIELGLVHRLESVNSFVACAHSHDHGTCHGPMAFAICDRCGRVDEFSDPVVNERLRDYSKGHSFKAEKTIIELHGTCATCLAA
ncbi:Fur family transcriptional regulator [Terrihabitans sp. B22-R8]|uniref:Fur family transcriptional regulator n=1 Tax=Terrihabitans sp. B22-R8 TaxID=3425128 RepID=UPI00403C5247